MKKLLLGLGAMTAIAAPVVVAVSCGDDTTHKPVFTSEEVAALNSAHQNMWMKIEWNDAPADKTVALISGITSADAEINAFISKVKTTITEIKESSTEAATAITGNAQVTAALALLDNTSKTSLQKAAVANHLYNLSLPYIAKFVNETDAELALKVLIGSHNTSAGMHVTDHASFLTYKTAADATIATKTTSLQETIAAN